MTEKYYSDILGNYLIILCPGEALEGYQYRMIAVNHIPGLLPSSLRSVDGDAYLYYDITSRQSLARRYERRVISGTEMRKILYSITEIEKNLSKYLLDEMHLFMDPEYIFYDYAEEKFLFVYYPEQREENSLHNLMEYLAEKADPQDAEGTAVIYRLFDLSANAGFVLREELLDHEYEQVQPMEFSGRKDQGPNGWNSNEERSADRRYRQKYGDEKADDLFAAHEAAAGDINSIRKEKRGIKNNDEEIEYESSGRKLCRENAGVLVLAIIFMAGAAGLGAVLFLMPIDGTQRVAALAGMAACLLMSIIFIIYGIADVWHRNQKEDQRRQKKEEEKRRNAMMPSMEYGAGSTGTKRK